MLDAGSSRLSWRRVNNLLARLPLGSELLIELHGEQARWSAAEHLLANLCDLLMQGNWQRGGDKHARKPAPLPRPGDIEKQQRKRTQLTPRQVQLKLQQQLARRAAELAALQPAPVELAEAGDA